MDGVNRVILLGNLGRDPEVKTLDSGTKLARFPLATTETYKNRDGEKVSNTEWHNCVVWRGLAEVVEKYLKKGNQVYVEGKIRTRKYQDKDGNDRYISEIMVDNMTMLGGGPKSEDNQQQTAQQAAPANVEEPPMTDEGDDLPF
jgi:single-strand DNA-binding protein